jgi:hypothetical protein
MKVLVCGGRDYSDRETAWRELDNLHNAAPFNGLIIIQGGAPGADALAREWCADRKVMFINETADWKKHGRAAGPIRNQLMLDKYRPDLVLAFPGGRGTADMTQRAEAARVPVIRITGPL